MTIVNCQGCNQQIRLPSDIKSLIFTCPSCHKKWKWNNPRFTTIKGNHDAVAEKIRNYVNQLRNYKPKVAIIGKSGAGKSSLINALFKSNVSKVSHVDTGTMDVKEFNFQGIKILDFPGLADLRQENESKFIQLYENKLRDVDLAIWVISATDRANDADVKAYTRFLKPHKDRMPTIFVLSKCDTFAPACGGLNPMSKWDYSPFNYGPKAEVNNLIIEKQSVISRHLQVSTWSVEPIAISFDKNNGKYYSYNLDSLVEKIVKILPNEKKYSFTRECHEENVSKKSMRHAEKGLWTSVKEYVGDTWDNVKDIASDIIEDSAPKFIRWASKKLKEQIKRRYAPFL